MAHQEIRSTSRTGFQSLPVLSTGIGATLRIQLACSIQEQVRTLRR